MIFCTALVAATLAVKRMPKSAFEGHVLQAIAHTNQTYLDETETCLVGSGENVRRKYSPSGKHIEHVALGCQRLTNVGPERGVDARIFISNTSTRRELVPTNICCPMLLQSCS